MLRDTRDLLLPRLMSGELEVADLDIACVWWTTRRDTAAPWAAAPRTSSSSSPRSSCSSNSAGSLSTHITRRLGQTERSVGTIDPRYSLSSTTPAAIERLNPDVPAEAVEQAVVEITKPRTVHALRPC